MKVYVIVVYHLLIYCAAIFLFVELSADQFVTPIIGSKVYVKTEFFHNSLIICV